MEQWILRSAVCIILTATNCTAFAHEEPSSALDKLTDDAELIMQGRVTKVEYGMAPKTESSGPVPFSFVTFSVDETIKGQAADTDNVTLRFVGGPLDDKHYMVFQGVPSFDVGDEDLLFVRGNGERGCPLVDCGSGRMRIIEDQLYSDDGFEIQINPAGNMVYGKRRSLAKVKEHSIGKRKIRWLDVDEADSAENDVSQAKNEKRGEHANKQKMKQLLAAKVKKRISPEKLRSLPAVASARAKERISFRGPKAGPPGREKPQPVKPDQGSDEAERLELEALERGGGNPVLPTAANEAITAARNKSNTARTNKR
ncbi:MAG: hypothetical protein ACI9GW_001525 [Halieaceae bacterium]|jgi:hypothetical protein